MSATQPASTTELKEYCLRKLGKPVIDVNLADEQMNDMIDESIQMFQEYHFDGAEAHYYSEQVVASTLTLRAHLLEHFQWVKQLRAGHQMQLLKYKK